LLWSLPAARHIISTVPRKLLLTALSIHLLWTSACARSGTDNPAPAETTPSVASVAHEESHEHQRFDRDLSGDESTGGHTLARHVGRSDRELFDRLKREPGISSASTYTDRAIAEHVVGAALAQAGPSLAKWIDRTGPRPNYVIHYRAPEPIGRSVTRTGSTSVTCTRAIVVLRWDERRRQYYVLTSYPEENR